ncbi:cobyric acid synthase [Paraclostridium bifermentans]|uniref:cobyric acid synthase n=1 Tax=Paraclostridium bifermentans TaxID=1490 RepID=UPI003D27B621
MSKSLMFLGTASNVGKSTLAAGLCRILKQDGYSVAPFKSQNMALNSYITKDGLEMGRAQVTQAEAAGIEPDVRMNPILLKPSGKNRCQVIVNGKVLDNVSSSIYHDYKEDLALMLKQTYKDLSDEYDVIVLEGAGSCAEINLKDRDIANMGMAEIADAPVVLVADIDRGGVFASIAGTMILLEEKERERVKGVIINKFRGTVELLQSGIDMLEDIIKVPVLGVVPYSDLNIEDEDSVTDRFKKQFKKNDVNIEIIRTPYMSNFTDMHMLEIQEDVSIRYIEKGESLSDPDMVIIPGSKNTIEDLIYIRESGLEKQIKDLQKQGKLIFGICGGYQLLGNKLYDPEGIEGSIKEIDGIGLLDIETKFEKEKVTTQVEAIINKDLNGYLNSLSDISVKGYEIHMGETDIKGKSLLTITKKLEDNVSYQEGCINEEGNVVGTYIHGIFDDASFTREILNSIRKSKGLEENQISITSFEEFKNKEYDKLAKILRECLDMEKIYEIING